MSKKISADDPAIRSLFRHAGEMTATLVPSLMETGGPLFVYFVARAMVMIASGEGYRRPPPALAVLIEQARVAFDALVAEGIAKVHS